MHLRVDGHHGRVAVHSIAATGVHTRYLVCFVCFCEHKYIAITIYYHLSLLGAYESVLCMPPTLSIYSPSMLAIYVVLVHSRCTRCHPSTHPVSSAVVLKVYSFCWLGIITPTLLSYVYCSFIIFSFSPLFLAPGTLLSENVCLSL